MKVICGWCEKVMKKDDGKGGSDSHGICDVCSAKERKKFEEELKKRKK